MKPFWISFYQEEQGQATLETVLLLGMMISIFSLLKKILYPSLQKLMNQSVSRFEESLSRNLYSFKVQGL